MYITAETTFSQREQLPSLRQLLAFPASPQSTSGKRPIPGCVYLFIFIFYKYCSSDAACNSPQLLFALQHHSGEDLGDAAWLVLQTGLAVLRPDSLQVLISSASTLPVAADANTALQKLSQAVKKMYVLAT